MKQYIFERMIFEIWILLPWQKMNIFVEWIFCHKKLNELLNEWKNAPFIGRMNKMLKENIKFEKKGPKKYEKQMKIWKQGIQCEKGHKRDSQSSSFGLIKHTLDHWVVGIWIISPWILDIILNEFLLLNEFSLHEFWIEYWVESFLGSIQRLIE